MLIAGIVFFVLGLVAFFFGRKSKETWDPGENPFALGKILGTIFIPGGALLLICSPMTIVEKGHRGVVVIFNSIDENNVLKEGFQFCDPRAAIHEMPAFAVLSEGVYPSQTSDTQSVDVTVLTTWRPNGDSLGWLLKNYGPGYGDTIVSPAVRECVKAEVAKFKVTELVGNRPEIHRALRASLTEWLSRYKIEVQETSIANIDFSEKYDAAIEDKQKQEQIAIQKEYELKRTITEAQMAAAQAKGESDSKIARATGDAESVKLAASAEAEALRIRGEAQADFNRKVAESLSPLLIQGEFLKKWDGRLPVYSLGANTNPMLMLSTDLKETK